MYHRIADESFDPWALAVTPENFLAQMEWLAANRTVLPLSEFALRQRNGTLPAAAAAVTFDDGYACATKIALPILERLGVPATVFVPADLIDRGREFWWDELEQLVLGTREAELAVDGQSVALGERSADDRRWRPNAQPATPRQKAFHQLWSRLRVTPPADLRAAMEHLRGQSSHRPAARESHRPLTAEEAAGERSELLEWGSHALSHPSLPLLSSEEKRREIVGSVERCAALTGCIPKTFAYPYGDRDEESEALVAEAGFVCGCTTQHRAVARKISPFALPRVHVGNCGADVLSRELRSL